MVVNKYQEAFQNISYNFDRIKVIVIPAKAGIQPFVQVVEICPESKSWIPAFAGMTV
jgi:hypothetical protein